MVAHVSCRKYGTLKKRMTPEAEARGITEEQVEADHKALELQAWRERKKNRSEYKMKTFGNYFQVQDLIASRSR